MSAVVVLRKANRKEEVMNECVAHILSGEETKSIDAVCFKHNLNKVELKHRLLVEVVKCYSRPLGHPQYMPLSYAASLADCSISSVQRGCARLRDGLSIIPTSVGRPTVLNPLMVDELKSEFDLSRVIGLKAATKDDLMAAIDSKRRRQHGLNNEAYLPALDSRTVNKILHNVVPEKSSKASVKNDRRVKAANDPFNFINQTVMNLRVFNPSQLKVDGEQPLHAVDPDAIDCHNIDEAQFLLNKHGPIAVYGPAGSKQALTEYRLGFATTQSTSKKIQMRSVKLFSDTSEAGHAAFAWVIFDRNATEMRWCSLLENLLLVTVPKSAPKDAAAKGRIKEQKAARKTETLSKLAVRMRTAISDSSVPESEEEDEGQVPELVPEFSDEEDEDEIFQRTDADDGLEPLGDNISMPMKKDLMQMLIPGYFLPLANKQQSDSRQETLETNFLERQQSFASRAPIGSVSSFAKLFGGSASSSTSSSSGISSSSSTSNSSSSSNSSSTSSSPPTRKIVYTMDGDYPGIQMVMDVFTVAVSITIGLMFLKWCAACSLLFQPNDLQICFMSIRRYLASKQYEDDKKKKLPEPIWLKHAEIFLTGSKLDKSSVDTYINSFPLLWLAMQKTYTSKNIMEGWQIAKTRSPFDIINRCPAVMRLSDTDCKELKERVFALASNDFDKGMVTDEQMRAAGIDKFFDPATIVSCKGKPLNHQRSLLLTSEDVRNMHTDLVIAASTAKMVAQKKSKKLIAVTAAKRVMEEREFSFRPGPPPDAVFCCARGTCAGKEITCEWKGCPVPDCHVWNCFGSKACINDLIGHVTKHLAYEATPR